MQKLLDLHWFPFIAIPFSSSSIPTPGVVAFGNVKFALISVHRFMNKHKNEHRQQYSGITCLMAFYFCSAGCPSQAFEGDTDDEFDCTGGQHCVTGGQHCVCIPPAPLQRGVVARPPVPRCEVAKAHCVCIPPAPPHSCVVACFTTCPRSWIVCSSSQRRVLASISVVFLATPNSCILGLADV